MSSAVKRKRPTGENAGTPKRARSTKAQSSTPLSKSSDNSGWGAFPAPEAQESTERNVKSKSPDAVNFEDFVDTTQPITKRERTRKAAEVKKSVQFAADEEKSAGQSLQETDGTDKALISKTTKKKNADTWKISEPIGGRLVNMDPVFTVDEKYGTHYCSY